MGSVEEGVSGTSIHPETCDLGTVFVSTIRIHGLRLSSEKYLAATSSSCSVALEAIFGMFAAGRNRGSEHFRTPDLKSCSWRRMYPAGSPAMVEFSGRPSPLGRWQ